MKYLGIDYGARRVGLALSDERSMIATPLETVSNDDRLLQRIGETIKAKGIEAIVVGEPLAPGAQENPVLNDIRAFSEVLKKKTGLPIHFITEQFSSVEAARFAGGNSKSDAAAAAIILQRFLDLVRNREHK